ncbi:MAG: alanyl-tRNA editing protein AlaXM [Promethearchaeota archaeon]
MIDENNALYLNDMYLKEFEAEVVEVKDSKYVVLNQTVFYPKSGGVENDTGILVREADDQRFEVVYVGKFNDNISHEVSGEGLKVGDKVKGKINWERRYLLMRLHTAAHLLSGVFFKEENVKITGNNLGVDSARIDFNMPDFDRTKIEYLVKKANELIKSDLPIKVYYISREELTEHPELIKLAKGIDESLQKIRIVEIENFDKQPDGGCHVNKLSEIGEISIVKIQNKGKNNRRLYFKLI